MPCYCPACTDQPRETYTEAHRHACEVQMVVDMPSKADRVAYFTLVAEARGSVAAGELRRAAIAAWQAQESLPAPGVDGSGAGVSPTPKRKASA